ncbi:arsenate reductase (glutaredoxin) [Suttonella sp. R2A3]|uniref:arsenate reductase (glutaredoxin) n=1 Tax=Suttonella sp. R2A3 TaxID=2908648 RepID=UPI001EEC6A37|nr:arsenate reductase (glutaredoxin) [Suttonella sp. R2A3]UJF25173.1 arsenate reductase (glutaredoxin) [Suttonella sp. R2A3]
MEHITIYHNPECGTSRNVLGLIRNAGIEPEIIYYLDNPPDEQRLRSLLKDSGLSARDALRKNVAAYEVCQLDDLSLSEDALIEAMLTHPILINRPFVVTSLGTKLCRPSEVVLSILNAPQQGAFYKEDGELLVDAQGQYVGDQ